MQTRRSLLQGLAALLALPALCLAKARPQVVVYKNAGCGCCSEWEKYMRAAGYPVESHELADLTPIKRKLGVPEKLASCHTAIVDGYVIEGHVPAADIAKILQERPKITGLAVPGMPSDAPGMDMGRGEPYQTIAFDAKRSWLFAQH